MSDRPLTVRQVQRLADVVDAAAHGKRVRWLNESDDLIEGVARCIAHDGGGFADEHDDVRDLFLHVSGTGEYWLPVERVADQLGRGEFAIDD